MSERNRKLEDLFCCRNAALLAWHTYSYNLEMISDDGDEEYHIGVIIPSYGEWLDCWKGRKGVEDPLEFGWYGYNGVENKDWLADAIDLLHDELLFWRGYNINPDLVENHELYMKIHDYAMSLERFYQCVTGNEFVKMVFFKREQNEVRPLHLVRVITP